MDGINLNFQGTARTQNGAYYNKSNNGKIVGGIAALIPASGIALGASIKHAVENPDTDFGKEFIEKIKKENFFKNSSKEDIIKFCKKSAPQIMISSALTALAVFGIGAYIDKTRNDKAKITADLELAQKMLDKNV